jgi:hypothetical protein
MSTSGSYVVLYRISANFSVAFISLDFCKFVYISQLLNSHMAGMAGLWPVGRPCVPAPKFSS